MESEQWYVKLRFAVPQPPPEDVAEEEGVSRIDFSLDQCALSRQRASEDLSKCRLKKK